MSAETQVVIEIGDAPKEKNKMPVDLSDNVAQNILTVVVASANQTANDSRNLSSLASGALQAGIQMAQNTLALTVAGRTVSGVVATDIGGPTNPAGAKGT